VAPRLAVTVEPDPTASPEDAFARVKGRLDASAAAGGRLVTSERRAHPPIGGAPAAELEASFELPSPGGGAALTLVERAIVVACRRASGDRVIVSATAAWLSNDDDLVRPAVAEAFASLTGPASPASSPGVDAAGSGGE
jgi:hypothetical protein